MIGPVDALVVIDSHLGALCSLVRVREAGARAARDRGTGIAGAEHLLAWTIHRAEAMAETREAVAELLAAVEMVRAADDDCRLDGLQTIPAGARARIDAAIARVSQP